MADTKSSRVVGYVREDEEICPQIDALRNEGASLIYREKDGGLDLRPELERCLASLSEGDSVLVYSIDRIALSLRDFMQIAERVSGVGASIRSLTQPINTAGPVGSFLLDVLKQVAELESSVQRETYPSI